MNKKSVFSALILITIGIIFGVILVSSFSGGIKLGFAGDEQIQLGAQGTIKKDSKEIMNLNSLFIEASKLVQPTVVSINVVEETSKRKDELRDFFHFFGPDFQFPEPQPKMGSGSGVIIHSDGYVLTNNHVVANAAKGGIEITLSDKRVFKNAEVVGTDPTTDLAVIKIDGKNLPVASLGDSEKLQVGEWVIAIGNPLGLQSTVTAGIISAIGRGGIGVIRDSWGIESFIQTDAAINPGNSGGPLVNLYGEVIGINTAIATTNARYQGYGFAIPINIAKYVAQDIIRYGKVRRGYLGIQIGQIDETMAKALKLEKPTGVIVQGVMKDGGAYKAGIEEGDVILEIDEKEMKAPNEVQSYIATKHPGDVVNVKLYRKGKIIQKKVTLGSRDSDDVAVKSTEKKGKTDDTEDSPSTATFEKLGFSVRNLTTKEKKELDIENGVLITEVKALSEAQKRGLQVNDVILEINRDPVSSVKVIKNAINDAKKGDSILLRVRKSDTNSIFLALEIP